MFDANTVEVGVGPAASCVIFLPSFTNHGNPNDMNNAPIFFAASLSTQVLVSLVYENLMFIFPVCEWYLIIPDVKRHQISIVSCVSY